MENSALPDVVKKLAREEELMAEDLDGAFDAILQGKADPEHVAAFLMGLAIRGETSAELIAGARALRQHARKVDLSGDILDTCGTGGLGWTSLNTSTATAILIAACGGKVAKHGNRSVSPKTGSADVLEALGVSLDVSDTEFRDCMDAAGVGFLFARAHHSAMKHVAPIRAKLGIRTIFNLLGPLSNPSAATHQLLGVYDQRWLRPMAEALLALGVKRAWVVHGRDSDGTPIDEMSIAGETQIISIENGKLKEMTFDVSEAGLPRHRLSSLSGGKPKENAKAIQDLFAGQTGPFRDAVCLNSGAGLHLLGIASNVADGAAFAGEHLDNGSAQQSLAKLVSASNGVPYG